MILAAADSIRAGWPGTYALILAAARPAEVAVGRLGAFTLAAGRYAYVCSACGPGGVTARLNRHLRPNKALHWHIDYLTAIWPTIAVFAAPNATEPGLPGLPTSRKLATLTKGSRECAWVRRLLALPSARAAIPRFGSSDCREGCPAHLIRLPDDFELGRLPHLLREIE